MIVKGVREMILFLRLAWRNLWRHRRRTLIVVLAIGLTIGLMMLYDGVMSGFEDAIYGNAIKVLGGNIQVHALGYQSRAEQVPLLPMENDQAVVKAAAALPQVEIAARRINTGGLITSRRGAFAVGIVAVEPEKELASSLVAKHVSAGSYLAPSDQDVIFIGKGLADAMEVKIGDRVSLAGRATHNQTRTRTMTVGGIYDLGMADIEKQSIYMTLSEAQSLYGLDGQVTEVAILLKQLGQEPGVIQALKTALPGVEITSWETNFPELKAAINTKGAAMNIFSIVMLGIAGIGTLNLLLMAVYERTREIGLLGALGFRPAQITLLFLIEGAMMGLVGVGVGVLFGLGMNIWLRSIGLDMSAYTSLTSYMALITTKIYPTLGLEQIGMRTVTALVISLLASLIPAWEAAQNEPAKSLHFV
jgi:ABC-type lipoprotein release transport system permease subunit